MRKEFCALALDMGGTFIKSGCVGKEGLLTEIRQTPTNSAGDAKAIIGAIGEALAGLREQAKTNNLSVAGIGICTPGPFDYRRKMSLMRHKFQSVYSVNLEDALRDRGMLAASEALTFIQDANCFLMGEWAYGAARGVDNCTLVTLGTGLGFAAMAEGALLTNGRNACYIALYRQPWKDGLIEDVVSARGICAQYEKKGGDSGLSARQVCERADAGDPDAADVMAAFGYALGKSVAFHMVHTYSNMLVVGGQISKSFGLFENSLMQALREDGCEAPVRAARYPEEAALLGAGAQILGEKGQPM